MFTDEHRESVHANSPFAAGMGLTTVGERAATHGTTETATEPRLDEERSNKFQRVQAKKPREAAPLSASLRQAGAQSNLSSIRVFQGTGAARGHGRVNTRRHHRRTEQEETTQEESDKQTRRGSTAQMACRSATPGPSLSILSTVNGC